MLVSLVLSLVTCAAVSRNAAASIGNNNKNSTGRKMKISIKIGTSTFSATLYDNGTATGFKSLLPLTINMIALNGNEKHVDLPRFFQKRRLIRGKIQNGDLMLFGSSTLVLFYKTFTTSYSYTKTGRIDDITGLAAVLGSGNGTVTYELGE